MVYIRGVQPDSLGRYCVLAWTGRVLTHVESFEEGFVRQVDGHCDLLVWFPVLCRFGLGLTSSL